MSMTRDKTRTLPLLPLSPIQPLLARLARYVARRRPELFERLGHESGRRFLIDPEGLPFTLFLQPDPARPVLKACRRAAPPPHDAQISGAALTLFDMLDGRTDSDALFFTRDLKVTGNVQAVVTLRNALDDLDGSIADDCAAFFGLPGRAALGALRRVRARRHEEK